jgi:hypothetical protein
MALVHESCGLRSREIRSIRWGSGADEHTEGMRSRIHPTYKTKYGVRALAKRGDVTLWLSPEAIATWEPAHVGMRGGQPKYSNLAIETSLTLRLLFHLPLRQTEGFLARRGQFLDLALRRAHTGNRLHLVVDSTALSIVGEGEWAAAKHGGRGKRGWKKLHLAVDLPV